MVSSESTRLNKTRNLLFFGLCFWFVAVVIAANLIAAKVQAKSPATFPFGVFSVNGIVRTQDFSYNMIYFRGIRDHAVPRPYRLEDQQQLMQQLVPEANAGMSHAYSPVAFVLVQPLLLLSGRNAYLAYTILCAVFTLLLFRFYLIPRTTEPLQLLALAICAVSILMVVTFTVGQSAPITTAFLAAFWALLTRRSASPSLLRDIGIGIFFWALCLKPSIAILPFTLLLGAMAWRPLIIGLALLLLTWTSLAGFYGGWWTGLQDYSYLLNHFNNGDFIPFMRRPMDDLGAEKSSVLFSWCRNAVLFFSLLLLILRWRHRITASEHFQGMIWVFLLLPPYLVASENWILCLLVVEGTFFQLRHTLPDYLKLLLLVGIFNLQSGLTFPFQVDWMLKCFLCVWIFFDLIPRRIGNSQI
jgi:hypothetical protein